jgi:ribosomal protein L11 methyltransferase
MSRRRAPASLETISLQVPDSALASYEAALSSVCTSVGFFRDHDVGDWRIEGVKPVGHHDDALAAACALAANLSGIRATLQRTATPADGWLARSHLDFPEQLIGQRFAVRGTHLHAPLPAGQITLTLDAGLAFGSGEHGSTRGCLRALEHVARRRPRRILDLGTGSGILALAAARLLHRQVLATDIEPWSVRVARRNAKQNAVGVLTRFRLADGWRNRFIRRHAPYDLVFANILARPLRLMASELSIHMKPGGTVILSGLLHNQARDVIAAHRRCGLRLVSTLHEGPWTTLIMRRPGLAQSPNVGIDCAAPKRGGERRWQPPTRNCLPWPMPRFPR